MNFADGLYLPWDDWLAMTCLLGAWITYAYKVDVNDVNSPNLISAMNGYRRLWMKQAVSREARTVDIAIVSYLSQGPAFMASTIIFILGGLFAALNYDGRVVHAVAEITGSAIPPQHVWQFRILVLIAIFIYAFFKFSWGMRQYNYCAILIAALPEDSRGRVIEMPDLPQRAAKLASYAATSINSGFRACYFGFAALAWLVQPMLSIVTTLMVVTVLYIREFKSPTVRAVVDRAPKE